MFAFAVESLFRRAMSRLFLSIGTMAVLLFIALTTTASGPIPPGYSPDIPWFLQVGTIDEGAYLQAREAHIAELRGFRDARPDSRSRAVRQMQQRQAEMRDRPSAPTVAWTPLGPAPIPNGQTQTVVHSVTGRMAAMAIDPTNSNILYVGAVQGGVWRSTDGGATFTAIFDTAQSLAIGALTLDPNDHTRLWVGTGEPNGSCDSYAGVGLYRIDNADTSATLVGPINPVRNYTDAGGNPQSVPVFNGRSISKILVNPGDSNMVFVSTAGGIVGIGCDSPLGGTIPPAGIRGLYRLTSATGALGAIGVERIRVSSAGGCFDTPCTGNRNVNDMVFDPSDANTLIVWQNGTNAANDGGVWRSTNALAAAASVTFTQTLQTTASSTSNGRGKFAIYKPAANPAVVYVASGEPSTGTSCMPPSQEGALRQSTDAGASWSMKLNGGGGFCGGQCFYNIGIAVVGGATPATDRVHIGGNVSSASCQRMHAVSNDGGATFTNQDVGLHADTHTILVDPNSSSTMYHLNDGGLWKSTNSGTTWTSLNGNGLSATQFQSLAVHVSDRHFTLGGTQDNGTECLGPCAGNPPTTWIRADFGDGGYALIDQSTTSTTTLTMYHTYFNATGSVVGFARVTNAASAQDGLWAFLGCGGTANGIGCGDTVQFYAPMALGPGTPNTVYYGSDRLYRSTNQGTTATVVSQAPFVSGIPVSSIGISPQNDNGRIVGLRNGRVFATTTGANPLPEVTGNLPTPLKYVGRAVFDPTDITLNTAYVALGGYWGNTTGHVWKTTNLSAGVGTTWTAASGSGATSLPDVPVNALVVDMANPNYVYAGTDIGVYQTTDGGATWNPYGTGLPVVAVFGMAISNDHRILKIGTHGRGAWEIGISAVPTAVTLESMQARPASATSGARATASDPIQSILLVGTGFAALLIGMLALAARRRNTVKRG